MAMDFGKNNRSVAFNPTSAFPLDARSYFESLESAQAAAAIAEEVGSTNTIYYYGQTVVVVENNLATLYIIQPNKTLVPVNNENNENVQFLIDDKQFSFNENGALSLKGFNAEIAGKILTADESGNLIWIDQIDTYTKAEIDNKIASADHLKRMVIASVDAIQDYIDTHDDAKQYIFMVKKSFSEEDSNKYDEYLVIDNYDNEGIFLSTTIELVGSWEVDLEDYAKISDLEEQYVKQVDGSRLITTEEINKLESLIDAEKNKINDVSSDFTIDSERVLNLNKLSQDKIIGLEDSLANKVDKIENSDMLVSPTDREILNKLILNNGDDIEISGTIHVDYVRGLAGWITTYSNQLKGLSANNYDDDSKTKLDELLYIKDYDKDQLSIDDSGKLSIKQIGKDQVEGLKTDLDNKVDSAKYSSDQTKTETAILSIQTSIASLDNRLTWQELS